MINVLAILAEIDLYTLWIPDTESSRMMKEITPMRKSINVVNVLPWPMWKREFFLEAGSFLMRDHQALGISLESIRHDSWFGMPIERHP